MDDDDDGDDGDMSTVDIKVHRFSNQPELALKVLPSYSEFCSTSLTPMEIDTPIHDDHVRVVCISDTHGKVEKFKPGFIPNGDILIHAGDVTMYGFPAEVEAFNSFLGHLPHTYKIIIAGNHDLSFDRLRMTCKPRFVEQKCGHGFTAARYENYLKLRGVKTVEQLLTNCIYLQDSHVQIMGLKIYGSPWTPRGGKWAFKLNRGRQLLNVWNKIPADTDILVTHGPPAGFCDLSHDGRRAGCVELLQTVKQRVKPRYHIFGHIHEDISSSFTFPAHGVSTDGHTTFINASLCTKKRIIENAPIIFDVPVSKATSFNSSHPEEYR